MNFREKYWFVLTSSTVVVAPLLIAFGVVVSLSNAEFASDYWLDLSSKATVGVLFLAPGFAALAAWDAARWRTLAVAPVRSWLAVALFQVAYVAVASAVTYLVVLTVLYRQHTPSVGRPRLELIAFAVWVTAAYSVFGLLVGRYVSRLKAVPLAFGLIWLWVAYTPAIQPFWLRNVTGNIGTSCCSLDRQLAAGGTGAPLLFTVGLIIACLVLIERPSPRRLAGAMAGVAITTALAAWWVADLGADPVVAREDTRVCADGADLEICAWPEHASDLNAALPVLETAAGRLRTAGLEVPFTLDEDAPRDGWSFTISSLPSSEWRYALATSPLNAFPPACAGESGWGWSHGERLGVVAAWLRVKSGQSVTGAAAATGAPDQTVTSLLGQSRQSQLRWFEQSMAVMSECERV